MKIGCVTRHYYPTDQEIRITKFARTLYSFGHKFIVFCPAEEAQASLEKFEYGEIVRFKSPISGFLGKSLVAPLPISLSWVSWFVRQFRKHSIDVVIVRDLRLSLPAFIAARMCKIKTILDLGEHYPGMMEIIGKQKLAHYVIRNHVLITWLEAISVRMADLVWVVVDENRERLKSYSSRIEVVSNYPVSGDLTTEKTSPTSYDPNGPPINLISLGLIDSIRGLDLAVDAFSILYRNLGNVRLLIYGDGPHRVVLENQVKTLRLEDKVYFGGWIANSRQFEVLRGGDIGLILHKVCALTQHTIPNKLFDYMKAGLPVVSTRLGPISRILESEQCGIAVDESPESVAAGIKDLILDTKRRVLYSENGYRAVRTRYKWASEEIKVLKSIISLTRQAV